MSYPYETTIGSRGGTIAPGDGFQIVIPQNTFSSQVTIRIEAPTRPASVPRGAEAAGLCYRVVKVSGPDPDPTKLVDIKAPFDSSYEASRSRLNLHYNISFDDPGGWMPAPTRLDDGTAGILGGRFSGNYLFGYFCHFKT